MSGDIVHPSSVTGTAASPVTAGNDEALRRERARILALLPNEKEYDKLSDSKALSYPCQKLYAHALKFTKDPAFSCIDDVVVRHFTDYIPLPS
jgi:hypothetical protein